jgi:hypothetical protein
VPASFPFVWLTFFPETETRPDPELSPDPVPGPDPEPDPDSGPDPGPFFCRWQGAGVGTGWGGLIPQQPGARIGRTVVGGLSFKNFVFKGGLGNFSFFSFGRLG